jgi:hypothetical protein
MKNKFNVSDEEKNRIRNLHITEESNKKISSRLNEQDEEEFNVDFTSDRPSDTDLEPKMKQVQMSDAGDYHIWSHCGGGGNVALFDNNVQTANGQSCHNAVNQNIPGLVLACNQALVNFYGTGPVIQWGTGNVAAKSCWQYVGTQFYNNVPNAAAPNNQGGGVAQTLQSCNQCAGQGDLGWMCVDIGPGPQNTGCQQVVCPQGITNTPGGCWSNQIDCNNGGLNPSPNANPCGGYQGPTEYECTTAGCVPWIGGQYATLSLCQQSCGQGGGTNYCVNCAQQQMASYQVPGSCPQGFVDIGSNPSPTPGPCVECVNNLNCMPGGNQGWSGDFNSMADCQNSPTCGQPQPIGCINGQCQPDPNGTFANVSDCQASGCGQVGTTYDCVGSPSINGACTPVQGSGGAFQSMDDCLVSPCQCDSIVQAWPFYQNNPNYTANGTWWTYPHDGPSNPNALSQILTNVQNSNAYTSTNPVQLHKAKCREAAILHWQGSGVNVQCCADQSFAVGYATSDPLGCVNQNFIDLLNNNFIPNSANWGNQGCNWLQNSLNNAQTQQQQFPQSSGGYCKLQGKIDFIQNLMQTGQSTYLTGSVSFTPPC